MNTKSAAVVLSCSKREEECIGLAQRLDMPLISCLEELPVECEFYLGYGSKGLDLCMVGSAAPGPVRVDFSNSRLQHRIGSAIKTQGIVKAVGIKKGVKPDILDATAGLGKDAFLLASLGCHVHMLERSAVVHALLEDGLLRAQESVDNLAAVSRLSLEHGEFGPRLDSEMKPDVIYLDPMFPKREKSARVKKDMFVLQKLLVDDHLDEELAISALNAAKKRVVVKRSKLAPYLGAIKPDIEFKGSSSRYDVYLTV
jgi:16S rRNA (guanine1516-N2)-methyltransferase